MNFNLILEKELLVNCQPAITPDAVAGRRLGLGARHGPMTRSFAVPSLASLTPSSS
jgi:hypothetical protein